MYERFQWFVGNATLRWGWFKEKAKTKSAYWWLGIYSFFETVVIPFPTDPFLAIMVHADRRRAVWLTVWTTITSSLAALLGYLIAYVAYDTLAKPLVARLGIEAEVTQIATSFDAYTFLATFIGAFSPVPFAPIIIAAGLLKADLVLFMLATVLGRGLRFALVSLITVLFGVAVLPRLGTLAVRATLITLGALFLILAVFILL